jgi:hypothetical protein
MKRLGTLHLTPPVQKGWRQKSLFNQAAVGKKIFRLQHWH